MSPRDPDSGKGRRPHVDHAFREVTRPGPHVAVDDTLDEVTPVEHLRAKVERVTDRVAEVEATIDMPSWAEFKEMRAEVAHCRDDRLKRERRAKWIVGAAFAATGTIATGAVAIVREMKSSSNASAVAADRFETMRATVEAHDVQLKRIGEVVAGHAAIIDMLKRTP